MLKRAIAVSALAAAAGLACGGGNSSPTAPTAVSQPVTTTPSLPTLTFEPQPGLSGAAMGIFAGSRGHEPGKVALAITAHNLSGVHKVRGTIAWDRNLLEFDAWGEGDFLKQGGALVDWTYFTNQPGLQLFLDRPSTFPGANGDGEIFLFRLRPRAGVTSGSSQVQWSDPVVYDASFRRRPLDTVRGGTITIR